MNQQFNIDNIIEELLTLDQFKVFDNSARILQESIKDVNGKHCMIKNVWLNQQHAVQFITHKLNIVPTGTIQLSDLKQAV